VCHHRLRPNGKAEAEARSVNEDGTASVLKLCYAMRYDAIRCDAM